MIEIVEYMRFYKHYPQYFNYNENINIIVDEVELKVYGLNEKCKLGIVYENQYFWIVVDLVENAQGKRYPYTRIINKNEYNGVVIIPKLNDRIVFLKQFRHGTREFEYELPRGFSEKESTIFENAERETFEELGVVPKNIEYLGNIVSDSGLSGGVVHIFVCEIDKIVELAVDEGIKDTIHLTLDEVLALINENKIRDSFSISAVCKLMLKKGQ